MLFAPLEVFRYCIVAEVFVCERGKKALSAGAQELKTAASDRISGQDANSQRISVFKGVGLPGSIYRVQGPAHGS